MNNFDSLSKKFDDLHIEYYSLRSGIDRVENEHRIINHPQIKKELEELKK